MLVKVDRRPRLRALDETGAVLVTVVVVMLVGFIVATVIAASVMFTIGANVDNRQNTQAFVAAESGRDAAVAALSDGCASGDLTGSDPGTGPDYSFAVRVVDGSQPTNYDDLSTQACPGIDTDYLVIRSIGIGPDSTQATMDSVYRWSATYSNVPGGVVTYFSGTVTQGVSHYTGDLVLRNGNWGCTEGGTLTGDLYVLNGTVTLSNNCVINGDIYAKREVKSNSQNWHVKRAPRVRASGTSSPMHSSASPPTGTRLSPAASMRGARLRLQTAVVATALSEAPSLRCKRLMPSMKRPGRPGPSRWAVRLHRRSCQRSSGLKTRRSGST